MPFLLEAIRKSACSQTFSLIWLDSMTLLVVTESSVLRGFKEHGAIAGCEPNGEIKTKNQGKAYRDRP